MSAPVVDLLEAVKVQVEHGQAVAGLRRVGDGVLQFALQLMTVGQSGQRIVAGAVLELAFGAAQFGHLVGHPDAHAVLGQPAGRPLDVNAVTVLVDVAVAEVALQRAVHHLFGLLQGRCAVVGMDQVEYSPAKHLVGGVAEDALEARTDVQEAALGVDDAGRVGQQVEHDGEGRQLRDHGIAGFVAPGRGAE